MGLFESLRNLALEMRHVLLTNRATPEGIRVVIYCPRIHQLHTLLAQLRAETTPAYLTDPKSPEFLRMGDLIWGAIKFEFREEEGR